MMSVTIICVGRLKDRFFEDACAEYFKRLQAFCRLSIVEIPAAVLPDEPGEAEIDSALAKEAALIQKKIPTSSRVYPLCIEGRQLSSEELSREFEDCAVGGFSSIVFIIGGSHGLCESIKKEGHLRLSMSKMTFPHRLARIMLLEQIYRAFSISAGLKYHK